MTQLRPPRAATPGTWLEANTCWPNTFAQNEKNALRETSYLTAKPGGTSRQRMDHPHGRGRERDRGARAAAVALTMHRISLAAQLCMFIVNPR